MYRLRKWYLDLLTPRGDYLFLYFASVRVVGITIRSLVLHVAPSCTGAPRTIPLSVSSHEEGTGEDRQVVVGLPAGEIRINREGCRVFTKTSGVDLDILHSPVTTARTRPVLIDSARGGHILWEPIGIRYNVEGRVLLDGSNFDIHGACGYADFLESTILPPRVPVRHLFWGRGHLRDADIAYMHASGLKGEPSWSRVIFQREGNLEESDGLVVTGRNASSGPAAMGQGGYTLQAPIAGREFLMTIRHQKTVQESSFVDQQKIRLPILKTIVKRITRDPRGSKFLSCAKIAEEPEFAMIDEEAYL